jgi:uncharacterized protein YdhG (YjbR/CyaY superfamily)
VQSKSAAVDAYIAAAAPAARPALRRIRQTVRNAAPHAQELLGYGIPAFRGRGILIYFGAFKSHIGVFPPIKADAGLQAALAPYRGPKCNLRFPLDQPLPYQLIERIVELRVRQDQAEAVAPKSRRAKETSAQDPTD